VITTGLFDAVAVVNTWVMCVVVQVVIAGEVVMRVEVVVMIAVTCTLFVVKLIVAEVDAVELLIIVVTIVGAGVGTGVGTGGGSIDVIFGSRGVVQAQAPAANDVIRFLFKAVTEGGTAEVGTATMHMWKADLLPGIHFEMKEATLPKLTAAAAAADTCAAAAAAAAAAGAAAHGGHCAAKSFAL
jgi:hypothetical protein